MNNVTPTWKFWTWHARDGDPAQGSGSSNSNPPESPHQPRPRPLPSDDVQNASSKDEDMSPDPLPSLTAPDTPSRSRNESALEVDMETHTRTQHQPLLEPGFADASAPLETSVGDPTPLSELSEPPGELGTEGQETLAGHSSASEPESALPQHKPDAADALGEKKQNPWNVLATSVDSFMGNLASAGGLRSRALERKRAALHKIDHVLSSSRDPNHALQDLQRTLSELIGIEEKLQESDDRLLEQGDGVLAQGRRIFGPEAQTSFENILEEQDFDIETRDTDTSSSTLSSEGGWLNQTPEGQHYLSKKGDVDLLRDIFFEIGEELEKISRNVISSPDDLETAQELKARQKELSEQLDRAEEELDELRDKLPDREVDIAPEHLRSYTEGDEEQAFEPPDLPEKSAEAVSHLLPGAHRQRMHGILQNAMTTTADPVKPKRLVESYLLYQLRFLPEEQERFLEILRREARATNHRVETDPSLIPLHPWFETTPAASRSGKSRTGGLISMGHSHATNSHKSSLTRLTAPDEWQKSPHFYTGNDAQRLDIFTKKKVVGRSSLP